MRIPGALGALTLLFSITLAGCGSTPGTTSERDPSEALVVYSGRNEQFVGPILADVEKAVGTKVEVRYGNTAELAAQLLEEGDRTEADLFFG